MRNLIKIVVTSTFIFGSLFNVGLAQEISSTSTPPVVTTVRAQVVEIEKTTTESIPNSNTQTTSQTLKVNILDGSEAGNTVEIENDYTTLKVGDIFYVSITKNSDGTETYAAGEPYRLPVVLFFVALFVLCVVLLGGLQGMRGLLSLIISFLFIIFLLIPGIAHGFSPVLVSIGVASLIIVLGSYITHGFNKTTSSAVIGMIITVIMSGLLTLVAMQYGHLTGQGSEDAVFLNLNSSSHVDLAGLLLGSILIGLLGVLYDISIGQAIAVEELHTVGPHLSRWVIYKRAYRIGKEHIGALVNTLAIAYVGVSLPLLLLFYSNSTSSLPVTLNMEIFATEIIRIMIGSIGLVIAVPITTFIAVFFLMKKNPIKDIESINEEMKAIDSVGHGHHH